ncbi:MAG: hypothetical protein HY558_01045 [Euryarchaeota archaeon]|nr:hypothetical protein [Euryarchaeota archaeon]
MAEWSMERLFGFVLDSVERHRTPYMVVGGIAAIAQGVPRFTEDVDIVLTARRERADRVIHDLLRAGLRGPRPEDVIHAAQFRPPGAPERMRIDLNIKLTEGAIRRLLPEHRAWYRRWMQYEDAAFRRRVQVPSPYRGRRIWVARPEDVIVSKVWFSKMDPRRLPVDQQDICTLLAVHGRSIERRYMVRWLRSLGLYREFLRVEEGCL